MSVTLFQKASVMKHIHIAKETYTYLLGKLKEWLEKDHG